MSNINSNSNCNLSFLYPQVSPTWYHRGRKEVSSTLFQLGPLTALSLSPSGILPIAPSSRQSPPFILHAPDCFAVLFTGAYEPKPSLLGGKIWLQDWRLKHALFVPPCSSVPKRALPSFGRPQAQYSNLAPPWVPGINGPPHSLPVDWVVPFGGPAG